MAQFIPDHMSLLQEALNDVRDLDTIQERAEQDLRNGKTGTTLGTGKQGTADTIQDKVMAKYGATKATVANITKGMAPKEALKSGMKQFAAGQGNHNPDVKAVLSDMALNYPHIFGKYFKKKAMAEDVELSEDEIEEGVASKMKAAAGGVGHMAATHAANGLGNFAAKKGFGKEAAGFKKAAANHSEKALKARHKIISDSVQKESLELVRGYLAEEYGIELTAEEVVGWIAESYVPDED